MNLLNNIQIKLLAILSAFLLWLFVVGVENYVFLLPGQQSIKVINLGPNVSIANELATVKVRYKATDNSGNNVNANEFELFIDADKLNEGTYNLDVNYISKNPKLSVVAVEPAQIALNLEAIASKEIKLKAEVSGKPAKDYEMKSFKLSQEKIKISGAASVLSKINELTLKVALDGSEKADFSRKISPEASKEWNLNGKNISFDPAVVQVDVVVRKIDKVVEADNNSNSKPTDSGQGTNLKRKTVMAKVVKEGDYATSVKEILPQNILVTLEGEDSVLASLTPDSVYLRLNVSKTENNNYTVTSKDIVLPEGKNLKIVEFSPDKVLVKY